jgi:hypothetical protein
LEAKRNFAGEVTGEVGLEIDAHSKLTGVAGSAGDARAGGELRSRIRSAKDGEAFDGGVLWRIATAAGVGHAQGEAGAGLGVHCKGSVEEPGQ